MTNEFNILLLGVCCFVRMIEKRDSKIPLCSKQQRNEREGFLPASPPSSPFVLQLVLKIFTLSYTLPFLPEFCSLIQFHCYEKSCFFVYRLWFCSILEVSDIILYQLMQFNWILFQSFMILQFVCGLYNLMLCNKKLFTL